MKIRIKKGHFRTVLIVFDVFVLKFPKSIVFLKSFFELAWNLLGRQISLRFFSTRARGAFYFCFLRGFKQNLDEFEVWRKTKAGFLTPTYLTLGIVNIQKFQEGEDLVSTLAEDMEEINNLFRRLAKITNNQPCTIDPHCFGPANFKRTARGYKMVDYGRGGGGLNFPTFLIRWHKEIATVLCRPPKQ